VSKFFDDPMLRELALQVKNIASFDFCLLLNLLPLLSVALPIFLSAI
jgi:hypothetical protein